MKNARRIASLIALVTVPVVFGCQSKPGTATHVYTVDAANGVRIAAMPALLVGGYGEGAGQVKQLGPVAVDDEGNLLIADSRLRRVTVLDAAGRLKLVRSFSPDGENPLVASDSLRLVQAMTWHDSALFVASGNDLWIIAGNRARKLDLSSLGAYMRDIAVGPDGSICALTEDYVKVYDGNGAVSDSIGLVDKEYGSPRAQSLAVGPDGNIYVSARTWGRVLVYSPGGELVKQIGRRGELSEHFRGQARGIAVDGYGNVFVRDDGASAIKVFRSDGKFVADIGGRGSKPGESLAGNQVTIDRARHRLILSDATNFRLQVYDLTGRDATAKDLVVHAAEYQITHRPSQVALSLGDTAATERRVAWKTDPATRGSQVVYVQVNGADPSDVDWNSPSVKTAEGSSVVHHSNLGPYAAHEVTLRELAPGARYAYRLGDGSPEGWSTTALFDVAENATGSITVAALGDSRNRMDVWREIVTKAASHKPAFIVNTGDLVSDGENMNDWNAWFYEARDVLNTIPIMPCLGNHERQSPNYFLSFALPGNAPDDLAEQCYSFDYGPAHWVVLNTEIDLRKQAPWLAADLARNTKPWTFVFLHRPAYAGHPSRGDGNRDVRRAWEHLFVEYGVDIVWQGHDHYYYRTKPIRGGEVVEPGLGPVYITTGGAGAPLYPIARNRYAEVAESVDHYCIMAVTEPQCTVTAYRRDGSVLDRLTLAPRQPTATNAAKAAELDRLETGE